MGAVAADGRPRIARQQLGRTEATVPLLAREWAWGSVIATLGGLASGVVLASAASDSPAVVSFTGADGLGWLMFVGSSVHVAFTACLFVLPTCVPLPVSIVAAVGGSHSVSSGRRR